MTNNINELNLFLKILKDRANLTDDFKKLGIDISGNLDVLLSNINVQRLKNNPVNLHINDIRNILLKKNNS